MKNWITFTKPQLTQYKEREKRDFTASVFIIEEDRILLLFHKKLNSWLPPGGHVEEGELPHEAALREAKEETGLDIELLSEEHLWVKEPNAQSLPRPFLCLLEEIPPYKDVPAHQHIDFVFIGRPILGQSILTSQSDEPRWFTFDEVETLSEGSIFPEVKQLINILKTA